jgi:ABC-type branched-subunit amino acid transport system substrate-binding protein
MQYPTLSRRSALGALAGTAMAAAVPAWAQPARGASDRAISVAQVVDISPSQIDVTKDFVTGARSAWQEINTRGGLQGRLVNHQVIEVDGSAASLRAALQTIRELPQCVALFGTTGDRTATQIARLIGRELPDIAHVAPWLQNVEADALAHTFPLFASRQEQIAHAIKSLSTVGITQLGAIYGSADEYATYRGGMEQIAKALKLSIQSYQPNADLQALAKALTPNSPRVLLFVGGTPELAQFSASLDKQDMHRYLIAMSDVNLQSIQQLRLSRLVPVIATQVVPLVNASLPIVQSYRAALNKFFDEPPTPHSLAGYIAARYTAEVLRNMDGSLTRTNVLQAFARRLPTDVGGFLAATDPKTRGAAYVTQSMISSDGRLIG